MALIGKVRGMRMRDGKMVSEIFRQTSLSRNTIKRWLQTTQGAAPKYRRREVSPKYPNQGHEMLVRRARALVRGHGRHRPARHLRLAC